jgi:hypothetical protein
VIVSGEIDESVGLVDTLAIVNVSLPPSLFSVKLIPEPAISLPFKYPLVVSLADTLTVSSVLTPIPDQLEPS